MKRLISLFALILVGVHAPAQADDWVRAESTHFVIYSTGSASQAEKAALELERLDAFLRQRWQRDAPAERAKLDVFLLKDSRDVSRMTGNHARGVGIAGIYRAKSYGSFFLGNRRQSKFDEVLTGREVLFHEYAHHFFYQNFAIPSPAWFSEGFADYVSSADVPESGGWAIGRPLDHHRRAIAYGGQVPIRDLLTGKDRQDHLLSFYAWSWGMTRFLYSGPQGRGNKITRYLSLLNDGVENLEAAEQAFGDLDQFAREMGDYVRSDRNYRRSSRPFQFEDQVTSRQLTKDESEILELRLHRLNGANAEDRLKELQEITLRPDAGADAWYELAQARLAFVDENENETADIGPIEKALDRALAITPDHMRANVLRGRMHLRRYNEANPGKESDLMIREAVASFERALAAEPNHPWPVFNLARGLEYADARREERGELIARAFALAPESGEIRFRYASHLAHRGEYDEAIRLLAIVANDPHGRGGSAATMIERLEELRDRSDQESEPSTD